MEFNKYAGLVEKIFSALYYEKALSCAELSARIDLSIPMISKALREMMRLGYVEEQGLAPSKGGRKPLLYALKANDKWIVTVAMDQLSARIGLMNLRNEEVAPTMTIRLTLPHNPEAMNELVAAIEEYGKQHAIEKKKVLGVGIGMPGFVNVDEGVNYTYLPAKGKSLRQELTRRLGMPVFLDNDSSLTALAELKFGKAAGGDNAMVVNIGWGIGLGMVLNGMLFRGNDGYAGELSHIPIAEDGKLCLCGKQGCLEAEASLLAVAEQAVAGVRRGKATMLQRLDTDHLSKFEIAAALMEAALDGDQYSIELLSEAGHKIGKALAILIHIMNPKVIILSGRGATVADLLMAPIRQALNKHCIKRLSANVDILVSGLGQEAELLGGTVLVVESILERGLAERAG